MHNFTYKTLSDNNKIASANFVLEISKKLDAPRYDKILKAIEDNPGDYSIIGIHSKRKFYSAEVEDYIGNFETVGDLMRDKIVNKNMAYDELGYDAEKAWCNRDVQKVITDARKADGIYSGSKAFYAGFEEFAKFSLSKDKKRCEDMDKE